MDAPHPCESLATSPSAPPRPRLPTVLLWDGQLVMLGRDHGDITGSFRTRYDGRAGTFRRATVEECLAFIRAEYDHLDRDPIVRVIENGEEFSGPPYVDGKVALAFALEDARLACAASFVALDLTGHAHRVLEDMARHARGTRYGGSYDLLVELVNAWSEGHIEALSRAMTMWGADLSGCEGCVRAALHATVERCAACQLAREET